MAPYFGQTLVRTGPKQPIVRDAPQNANDLGDGSTQEVVTVIPYLARDAWALA